jgi:signal transduction histidine kinase
VVDLMQTFAAQSTLALQNARLFREIQEKGRQLEIASEHKSQFLANMSHELRTPLNAILGYTELIIDGVYGAVPEKSRQVLDRVQVNGKHLLSLINDVLDLTKIEAGQLSLSLADYQVGSLIDGVISATGSLAQTKGLELRASVEPGLPTAFGDERRLKQVMLNLVGNALKFTDKGHVEVAALKDGDTLRLRVSDTGPGIAARDQAKVFEEFQQVDTSSTKEKGGSGLGLAITKRIVEMHGGTVGLTSEVGVGSVFTVTLPIRVAAKKVPHD